ncbi:hypothetical protein CFP56_023928 [Quercus suber]|uniref:Ankyrin repeat protein n=1 Tax=Quercus suber TaxID=58331 RepID=A0AAW0K7X3_QUESU
MSICIAEADPSLGIARNEDGETLLFLAALHGTTADLPKEINTTLLNKFPKNDQTCINFIQFLYNMVQAEEIKKIKEKHLFSAAILKFVAGSIKVEQFFEHGRDPVLTPYKTDQSDFVSVPEEEPTDGEKGSNPQPELKNESPCKTDQSDESDTKITKISK